VFYNIDGIKTNSREQLLLKDKLQIENLLNERLLKEKLL